MNSLSHTHTEKKLAKIFDALRVKTEGAKIQFPLEEGVSDNPSQQLGHELVLEQSCQHFLFGPDSKYLRPTAHAVGA